MKKKIVASVFFLVMIFFVWIGIRLGIEKSWYTKIQEERFLNEPYQISELYTKILHGGYEADVPVAEMANTLAGVTQEHILPSLPLDPPEPEFTLSFDLAYYSEPGKSDPVLVIPKGTELLYFLEGLYVPAGYGVNSLPGNEAGWRCVRPFMESSKADSLVNAPYYYIELSQLERAAEEYMQQETRWNSGSSYTLRQNVYLETRRSDFALYTKGIYESPDLRYSLWDEEDTILLSCGAAFLLVGISLLFCKRKRRTV